MQLDGVVAVGLGGAPDKPAIIVSCLHNEDELRTQLPASLKNIPVLVQRSGNFTSDFSFILYLKTLLTTKT